MRSARLDGVFFRWIASTLPLDFKKKLFSVLSAEVSRQVRKRGLTEYEVLGDFEAWRKERRAPRPLA